MSMIWRLESSWMYLTLFIKDPCTWCCYKLSIVVDLWYYLIYTVFYFELADDIYSVLVFVLTPTCMFLSLLFVEYNKHTVVFNSTATLARLRHNQTSGWAIVPSSDWILSVACWCIEVRTWTISFTYFSFLDTLRFSNLRIDVLVMMTSRFWG